MTGKEELFLSLLTAGGLLVAGIGLVVVLYIVGVVIGWYGFDHERPFKRSNNKREYR